MCIVGDVLLNVRFAIALAALAAVCGTAGCAKQGGGSAGSVDPAASAELTKLGAPVYPGAVPELADASDAAANGERKVDVTIVTPDDFQTVNAWYKAHVGPKYVYRGSAGSAVYETENLSKIPHGEVIISPPSASSKNETEIILSVRDPNP
jgi:hypothetical protein